MYITQTMDKFEELAMTMDVVLFGGGEFCMRFMNRIGDLTKRIKYILDNNSQEGNGTLYGVQIVSPEKLKEMDPSGTLVIITVEKSIKEIHEQISAMGDYFIMAGRILMSDVFSTVAEELYSNRNLVKEVYQLLYDDMSKKIYYEIVKRRILYGECDFSDLIVKGEKEYRIPIMYGESKPENEVILDCGAYEGDTLTAFITTMGPVLKRIYCFECMEDTLAKLNQRVSWAKNSKYPPDIIVKPYALSNYEGKTSFAVTRRPDACFVVENRAFAKNIFYESDCVEVNVSTIDKLVPEDEKVTFIKMDIEGSEYDAILGAKRVIQTCKPRLAISIYHIGKDYYRLPLLVKELVPEYKIAIRHHKKNHCDTDMYCWI